MRNENRKEDAVSPVIGVMLMLVVTVVIAAVVVTFSTGLAGSTGTTPTALFEVSGVETWDGMGLGKELAYLNIRHKGGDVIPLSELQITLESVGGANSGITHIRTATDSKKSVDMTTGELWGADDPDYLQYQTELYQNAKPEMDRLLAEYKTFLEDLGLDSDKYGRVTFWRWEEYERLCGLIPGDKAWDLDEFVYGLGYNDAFMMEEDGWVISEEGKVLGQISGGSAYPIAVLGQGLPTKSTVSTGAIIHVVPFDGNSLNSRIFEGTSVKWTISYIPTNSIIAKGEFEVIAD